MGRFSFNKTPIEGLFSVARQPLVDNRGFLARIYCGDEFKLAGFSRPLAQINHTLTKRKGTVRGMHYQVAPHSEVKLVTCLSGEIFDVAVDIRKGSSTFLKWYGEVLSSSNNRSLLIPEGVAHGFQTLSDDCELIYLHTASYKPEAERALHANDPKLLINWPLPIRELSERDGSHTMLTNDFQGT